MPTCYLCGKTIEGAASADHVPPQQFFAPALRQRFNLDRLATLPSHRACNIGFGKDEEYVVNALVPAAMGSPTANVLIDHHASRFKSGKATGLGWKILKSFDRKPPGVDLPDELVGIHLEGERVKRVAWKIVRGLHVLEYGSVLPEDTRFYIEIQEPENRKKSEMQGLWEHVKRHESKGPYQAVFAYKTFRAEKGGIVVYGWGMLWWDRIMVFISHSAPGDNGGGSELEAGA